MSSYILSIKQNTKGYSLSPGARRERLAAVVKENLMEIPLVIIPNHAPRYQFTSKLLIYNSLFFN
jgi:hypothetical protein